MWEDEQVDSVCVFCGSSPGDRQEYVDAAAEMGRALARRKLRLVYGGGNVGLMGVVADAVMAGGGEVLGVIPKALMDKELGHQGITELVITESMHERKQRMSDAADAFVAMPGGFGTLEEICEVLTWTQMGIHAKPCAFLNVRNYYDPLLVLLDHAVSEKFLGPNHRAFAQVATTPEDVLDLLANNPPVVWDKWLGHDET